jgi:hypothetical protein
VRDSQHDHVVVHLRVIREREQQREVQEERRDVSSAHAFSRARRERGRATNPMLLCAWVTCSVRTTTRQRARTNSRNVRHAVHLEALLARELFRGDLARFVLVPQGAGVPAHVMGRCRGGGRAHSRSVTPEPRERGRVEDEGRAVGDKADHV